MSEQTFSGPDLIPGVWYKFRYEGKEIIARFDGKTENEYKFSEQEPTDHELLWDISIYSNEAEDTTNGIKFHYADPGDVDPMWLTQGGKKRSKSYKRSKKAGKSKRSKKCKKSRKAKRRKY
jgi:hypothetical protein